MLHFLLSAVIIPLIVSVTTTLVVHKVVLKKGCMKESLSSSQSHTSSQSKGLFHRFKAWLSRNHTVNSNSKTRPIEESLHKNNQSENLNHSTSSNKKPIEEKKKDAKKNEKKETPSSKEKPIEKDGSPNNELQKKEESTDSVTQKPFTLANDEHGKEDKNVKHYTQLAVFQGKLIEDPDKTPYYRAWEEKGRRYYEFYCEDDVMLKAINNHSPLIDSFCDKENGSVDYENATSIVNVKSGILSSDNTISKKAIIKYV